MNRIEHHLLNMCVITMHLLRLREHQYLKPQSIYVSNWTKLSQGRESPTYHFYKTPKKYFGTRSIDKFSFRISTRRIILVAVG